MTSFGYYIIFVRLDVVRRVVIAAKAAGFGGKRLHERVEMVLLKNWRQGSGDRIIKHVSVSNSITF